MWKMLIYITNHKSIVCSYYMVQVPICAEHRDRPGDLLSFYKMPEREFCAFDSNRIIRNFRLIIPGGHCFPIAELQIGNDFFSDLKLR